MCLEISDMNVWGSGGDDDGVLEERNNHYFSDFFNNDNGNRSRSGDFMNECYEHLVNCDTGKGELSEFRASTSSSSSYCAGNDNNGSELNRYQGGPRTDLQQRMATAIQNGNAANGYSGGGGGLIRDTLHYNNNDNSNSIYMPTQIPAK